MRTIKFRAWDEAQQKMVPWEEWNNLTYYWKFFNGSESSEDADLTFMQFTGLLDKNGKEIYEGDIITFTEVDEDSPSGREETNTGVVEWVEDIAQWRFIYPSGQRRELHFITDFEPVYRCDVIGNIHQNPELLAVKQDK